MCPAEAFKVTFVGDATCGKFDDYLLDQFGIQSSEISDRFEICTAVHTNNKARLSDQFQSSGMIESMTGNMQVTVVILL